MKVLLVEDDARTAAFIMKGLREAGFMVEHAVNGEQGVLGCATQPFDVIIADRMLPGLDGLTMIGELRKKKVLTPIIILSAKGTVDDRVKGLQSGGDDYLVKPFSFSELLARIQALIRRANAVSDPTHLAAGDLDMDILARVVTRQGVKIELQPREFSLLEYLMRNQGRVVSKT